MGRKQGNDETQGAETQNHKTNQTEAHGWDNKEQEVKSHDTNQEIHKGLGQVNYTKHRHLDFFHTAVLWADSTSCHPSEFSAFAMQRCDVTRNQAIGIAGSPTSDTLTGANLDVYL